MTRKSAISLIAFLAAVAQPVAAQQAAGGTQPPSHPPEVAFVDEGEAGSVYRETTLSLRLYTHDSDPVGRSTCNGGCASAWPPLRAPANATPVGQWTIIKHNDGTRQWALQGKPVYTRFHDLPNQPTGVGIEGWRLIPYVSKVDSQITRAEALAATVAMWDVLDANHDGVLDTGDRDAQRGQAFGRIDSNRDGELSRAELGSGSPEFRSQQEQPRAAWFVRLDTDGSGGLSRAELAAGGAGARPQEGSSQAVHMFRMADANSDGQVTRAEFDAAVARHMDMVDANHDGQISKAEHEAGRAILRRMGESPAGNN